jgi:hypothetical protein
MKKFLDNLFFVLIVGGILYYFLNKKTKCSKNYKQCMTEYITEEMGIGA